MGSLSQRQAGRVAPLVHNDEDTHRTLIARTANDAMRGKTSNTGTFTLTASSTTTAVTNHLVGSNSVILWMPKTATAATAMTALYVSTLGKETFTLTHDSTADNDRTFDYIVVG